MEKLLRRLLSVLPVLALAPHGESWLGWVWDDRMVGWMDVGKVWIILERERERERIDLCAVVLLLHVWEIFVSVGNPLPIFDYWYDPSSSFFTATVSDVCYETGWHVNSLQNSISRRKIVSSYVRHPA